MTHHLPSEFSNTSKSLFIFIFFSLLFISPFWILGEYSSLGWFDEVNMSLPLYFYHNLNGYADVMPDYMGGTQRQFVDIIGNELMSLFSLLSSFFPLQIAKIIQQLLCTFFTVLAIFLALKTYLTNKDLSLEDTKVALIACASCALSYLPLGWSTYIAGFNLGGTAAIFFLCFYPFHFAKMRYLMSVGFAIIISLFAPAVFIGFQSALLCAIFLFIFPKIRQNLISISIVAAIILSINVFFWGLGLIDHIQATQLQSTRFLFWGATLTESPIFDLTKNYIAGVNSNLAKTPLNLIGLVVTGLGLLSLSRSLRVAHLFLAFAAILLAPLIVLLISHGLQVSVLQHYSWHTTVELLPLIAGFLTVSCMAGIQAPSPYNSSRNSSFATASVLLVFYYIFNQLWKSETLSIFSTILIVCITLFFTNLIKRQFFQIIGSESSSKNLSHIMVIGCLCIISLSVKTVWHQTSINAARFGSAKILTAYEDLFAPLRNSESWAITANYFPDAALIFQNIPTFSGSTHHNNKARYQIFKDRLRQSNELRISHAHMLLPKIHENHDFKHFKQLDIEYIVSRTPIEHNGLELLGYQDALSGCHSNLLFRIIHCSEDRNFKTFNVRTQDTLWVAPPAYIYRIM